MADSMWGGWLQEKPLDEYETAEITADTAYYFIADFEDDITAFFTCSPVKGKTGRRIEVYGDEGTLILDDALSGCTRDGKEFTPIDIPEHLTRPAGAPEDWLDYLWSELLKKFVASVNGLDTNVPTFFDGLKCQEIMDAVRFSGRENKWIQLA
jgi:predicted dehydrogenase